MYTYVSENKFMFGLRPIFVRKGKMYILYSKSTYIQRQVIEIETKFETYNKKNLQEYGGVFFYFNFEVTKTYVYYYF